MEGKMTAEIGFSELCLLIFLALVLVSPKDVGRTFAAFKRIKGKLYRLKFDLEDALMKSASNKATKENPSEAKAKESRWIVQAIQNFEPFRTAKKVAAFYPLPSEPDIRPVLRQLAAEKRLLLPLTRENCQMDFVEIHSLEKDLAEGRFHVKEPKKSLPVYSGEIPLALVPGTRFSRDGGRHGHGKGYYDRFLVRHPETIKCGIAFSAQVSEKNLERKPHDILMNYIVAPRNAQKEIPHVEKATVSF